MVSSRPLAKPALPAKSATAARARAANLLPVVCKYSNEAQDAGRGGLGAGLSSQITTDVPGGLRVTDVDKLTSDGARGGER